MRLENGKSGQLKGMIPVLICFTALGAAAYIGLAERDGTEGVPPRGGGRGVAYAQTVSDTTASADAFLKASGVFLSPRCVNCHPLGDHPLRGEAGLPHRMNVKRGPDGMGKDGLWCSTCHQTESLPGLGMPPGGPDWQLPPEDMPMSFEKQTPRELCEHLKDPAQNGGRTPQEVVEHVQTAPLVLWGWDPGEGRTPVQMPHAEFVKLMTEWSQKGAACPQ